MTVTSRDMTMVDVEQRWTELVREYQSRTPRSGAHHMQAREVMPGGDTRTVAFHPPYPLTIDRGEGYTLVDVDGQSYIDLLNNYTSLIHGHAFPPISEAVSWQVRRGTTYAAAVETQTRLASLLVERIPSVDKVRFTNSGTEATMHALRVARAFTGRDLIVKVEGGYHGTYDDFEVSVHPPLDVAGPPDRPIGHLGTRGVPANTVENVVVMPYNDAEAAEAIFAERGDAIGAVIVEPVMGSAGMIPADGDVLRSLRVRCDRHGAVLIFDEVMTLRLGYGGYQERVGVSPDLTTMAKIIGGGFPVGALGGRDEVMALFDPTRPQPLWQSGTFNGNAITTLAGAIAMEHFPASEVDRIDALGEQLRTRFRDALARRGLEATVTGAGSFVGVHLVPGPVTDYRSAARVDRSLRSTLHLALLLEGVFAAPRLMFCTSTPMDAAVIDEVGARFGRALDRVFA